MSVVLCDCVAPSGLTLWGEPISLGVAQGYAVLPLRGVFLTGAGDWTRENVRWMSRWPFGASYLVDVKAACAVIAPNDCGIGSTPLCRPPTARLRPFQGFSCWRTEAWGLAARRMSFDLPSSDDRRKEITCSEREKETSRTGEENLGKTWGKLGADYE